MNSSIIPICGYFLNVFNVMVWSSTLPNVNLQSRKSIFRPPHQSPRCGATAFQGSSYPRFCQADYDQRPSTIPWNDKFLSSIHSLLLPRFFSLYLAPSPVRLSCLVGPTLWMRLLREPRRQPKYIRKRQETENTKIKSILFLMHLKIL